ncbi:MAG TPA: EutN/CcmL family microcompartment protein [Anaerolineae bacterium]|nr:EutN/CcmL family microcompartment protein [Anaerolineae bacterium]
MHVAKVIGNVVATRKDESLVGFSLLVIEIQKPGTDQAQSQLVAVDTVGAGAGDLVLVSLGGAARVNLPHNAPVDATIVGVIDTVVVV